MCPWSLALASSIAVLGLERFCPRKGCPWSWIFLCSWPWPRALCPRLHLCFLDLSKVFDTVNHSILLQKLEKMFGFRGSALSFIKSLLTNRYQYTKTGDSKSRKQLIHCGVGYGSSLDLLLLLLHLNGLPQKSQLSTNLFVDDMLLSQSNANLPRLKNGSIRNCSTSSNG